MGRQVLRGEEKAVTELPRLEAWMGQQVSLYPREGSPRGRTIGLLRNVDERGVMLEEPGGIVSFYPWTVIFTIRVGEPEEEPVTGAPRAAGGTARGAASSCSRRARHR